MIPRTIPRAWVVPIFLVMDQTMHTGRKWNTASPISHRKLLMPAQNTDIWVSVLVPPSNRAISSMILRNQNPDLAYNDGRNQGDGKPPDCS